MDFLKHDKNPLPWNLQPAMQQQDAIDKVTKAVSLAVEKAVGIIAADGRPTIKGLLEKVTVKDGIKAEITLSRHDTQRHSLIDSTGNTVLMVVSSKDPYEGEKKAARPDPDQPTMIGEEYNDA